jgi:hypothetical protein
MSISPPLERKYNNDRPAKMTKPTAIFHIPFLLKKKTLARRVCPTHPHTRCG